MNKEWKIDNELWLYNSHSRFVFMTYYPVVNITSLLSIGRYTNETGGNPYGLICESENYFKLGMPEQAGFVYPASKTEGTQQLLTNRIDKYFIKNWAGTQSGLVVNIDDQQPATEETDMQG